MFKLFKLKEPLDIQVLLCIDLFSETGNTRRDLFQKKLKKLKNLLKLSCYCSILDTLTLSGAGISRTNWQRLMLKTVAKFVLQGRLVTKATF